MWGGGGRDWSEEGNPGRDWLYLGADDDKVWVQKDGTVDLIDCGRGIGRVFIEDELDPLDEFVHCEEIS
jgi:hypothetical protein